MLIRELPGFLLVIGYFAILPGVMAATVFRNFFHRMGFIRFVVFSNLVLLMVDTAMAVRLLNRGNKNET